MHAHTPTLLGAMTPFPFAVGETETLTVAYAMMAEHNVRHLPVVDADHAIVGVLSLVELWEAKPEEDERVGAVCARDPYVVDIDTPLAPVLRQMVTRHLDIVLVTRLGNLAGVFTSTDACALLAEVLEGYALYALPEDGTVA